jgi:hypothetical protein
MKTLGDVGPAKLLGEEQDRIRHAADNLIFSQTPDDESATTALADVESLCRALVDSGRWERASAMKLADDVAECGPARELELEAA